jgi:hypothetical protein
MASLRRLSENKFEPFEPPTDIILRGSGLSVYRASVPRTLVLVVALFSTGAATGAFAREFRAADTTCEDHPTIQALHRLARGSASSCRR